MQGEMQRMRIRQREKKSAESNKENFVMQEGIPVSWVVYQKKKDETAKTALIFQRKFLILKHRDVSLCNLCTFYPGKAHELQIVEYMQTEPMNHTKHEFVFQPRFG